MKLTKKQTRQLQKLLDDKKALPTMRIDEENVETTKNEDSPTLTELRSLDQIMDGYIRSRGPSN